MSQESEGAEIFSTVGYQKPIFGSILQEGKYEEYVAMGHFVLFSFVFLATPWDMEFPGKDQIQATAAVQATAAAMLDP